MTGWSVLGAAFGECYCSGTFVCTSDVDANGGIIIWVLVTLYMFKALGTVCDEYFVPSLEMISEALGLSNDVAGATFMAAGSSAPELFTSVVATFLIVNEGGVGAIIGSALFNILVIIGATCLFAGQELVIWWYPLTRDCVFYIIACTELALVLLDEVVQWWEALIMFLSYVVYCIYMKFNSKIADLVTSDVKVSDVEEITQPASDFADKDWVSGGVEDGCTSVVPHGDGSTVKRSSVLDGNGDRVIRSMRQLGRQSSRVESETTVQPANEKDLEVEEEAKGCKRWIVDPLEKIWELVMPGPEHYWILFGLSILNIALCTYLMVDAVNRCGCNLAITPLVMGLIFLAAGTSVPDALGSIAVAKQGEGDMAVANALGSNVFDILLGLGIPWLLKAVMGLSVVFPGAAAELLEYLGILMGTLVLFIGALVCNKWRLNRRMGAVLLGFYFVHVTVTLIRAFV